ncbi:MAG: hypothetical protein R3C14_31910 [Caldilineaceae bacterium]
MQPPIPITRDLIQQLAALQGLALTPDRAATLLPALSELLAVDVRIAALDLATLPAVGLPWEPVWGAVDDE